MIEHLLKVIRHKIPNLGHLHHQPMRQQRQSNAATRVNRPAATSRAPELDVLRIESEQVIEEQAGQDSRSSPPATAAIEAPRSGDRTISDSQADNTRLQPNLEGELNLEQESESQDGGHGD